MKTIHDDGIPPPGGHYSPCVEHNGLLYISGQLPLDPNTGTIPEGIAAQTGQVLSNIGRLLHAAGSSREKVLQVRIYVSDIGLWDQVNEVYAAYFGGHKPARCVVPSGRLHHGCLIEAEALAFL
jgi:reactive intermediate/imine deaminase